MNDDRELILTAEDFEFEEKSFVNDDIDVASFSYWQDAWRKLKTNKAAITAMIILVFIGIMCVIGPMMSKYGYEELGMTARHEPPSAEHWFGTDEMGRDIFARIWIGGRVSLILGLVGAFIDMVIGFIYGGISGYFGGKIDDIMMRILEIIAGIPYLVQVVLISLVIGEGLGSLIIAMTISGWTSTARMVRGQVMQIKNQEYILAARALGTPSYKIITKHVIPNILGIIIVSVTFDIPSFIFGEAFLSYIGLGIQPPMTSWGALASGAQQFMHFYPHQLFFPAVMISLTMLSFQLLGDGLRDALDPKLRQ